MDLAVISTEYPSSNDCCLQFLSRLSIPLDASVIFDGLISNVPTSVLSFDDSSRNQEVFVEKWQEKVTILGIDEYGFLKVRKSSTGATVTLHADVHSFDVRNGIIREKPI